MSTPSIEPAWSHGESLDRVLDAVRGQVSSLRALSDGSYLTNCVNPAHPDRHPSLHISHITSPHGGRVVFMCYSCGPQSSQDWAQWAGLDYDDLFDDRRWSYHNRSRRRSQDRGPRAVPSSYQRLGPLPKRIAADLHVLLGQPPPARPAAEGDDHQHHYVDVAAYTYLDEAGAAFHRVTRQRCTHEGCRAKNFPQSYVKRGGDPAAPGDWVSRKSESGWGAEWASRLFRHQQVADAVADAVPVWVLEGEKDVHTAEGCALVATTNPGGAANFPTHLAQVFAGAAIVNIVIDRDPEGIARAVRIHQMLTHVGVGQVRLWLPATTEACSDFSDHIQAGYAVEDLLAVPVDAALAWDLLDSPRQTGTITKHQAQLQLAADEVDAQLQVAQHERGSGRRAEATQRVANAARWVKEAAKVYAELVAAAQRVAAHVTKVAAEDAARDWTEQAGQIAQVRVRAARALLLSLYERTGILVPPEVDQGQVVLSLAPLPAAPGQPASTAEAAGAGLRLVPGGGGGDDGGATSSPVLIEHDHFEVVGGELTQVIWRAGPRGERIKVHRRVVNTPIRLVAKEFAESEREIDADNLALADLGDRDGRDRDGAIRAMPSMTHVVVQIPDGHGGWAQVRVPFDDFDSGSFLAHLPVSGLSYARGRAGRDKVITAISYISSPELTTAYRATGWRRRADGSYMYVMADGAIDAGGYQPLPTNLTGSLANFNLPDPASDGSRLRAAFLGASAPLVDRLPARIGAVLVGQAFRAALCPNEWVTVLSGSPGSIKTGSAALAMHYFGENWDRMRPASSMSGNGATDNAVRIMAHQAKDAVLFLDDNAPTVSIEQAWRRLESIARMIHNQEGRARSTRDGQATLPESRPRTSGLITTELPPRAGASGGRRMLVVPVAKSDIDLDEVIALDTMASRHNRALLMSSYLRWVATDRRGFMLRARHLRDQWLGQIKHRADVHPVAVERHGVKVAELWAGWALLLEFLLEQQALTVGEHQRWTSRIQDALLVAAECADDPDLVESTGQRACELLRHALGNGLAYVADAASGRAPRGLERRLGWKGSAQTLAGHAGSGEVDWRVGPQAIALGHLAAAPEDERDLELLCERAALEAALKAAASQMADTSSIDLGTVLRALEDEGVLKVRTETRNGNTYTRRTFDRTIRCLPSFNDQTKPLREKRIVLRLAALFGEADTPGPGEWPTAGPQLGDDPPPPAGPGQDLPSTGPAPQQHTPTDPATPQPPESTMQHTNAGGLTLSTIMHEQTRACVRCGIRCAVELGGLALHPTCFWATTAATVAELHATLATSGPHGSNGHSPAQHTPAEPRSKPEPQATTRPTASQPRPGRQFTAAASVVDVDTVWLPDGTCRPLGAPITHLGQLEQLGRDLHLGLAPVGWKTYPQPGTIVPTRALWEQLGVPVGQLPKLPSRRGDWLTEISTGLGALHEAVALGWVFGRGEGDPMLKATTKLRRRDAQRGSVQILMTAGLPEEWGLGESVAPAQVARRLQLYADTVGIGFGGSPINTGLDLFEATASRPVREALRPVDWSQIPPARQRNLETHFDWTRPPLEHETTMKWLAFFDRGQSYLATWSSLYVGVGAPEHHDGPVAFNARQAGWWRISIPGNTVDGIRQHLPYPDLLDPDGTAAGQHRWVTTPALEFAITHLDAQVDILEAWTWPEERTKRALDGLYKRFRAALAALAALGDQDAAAAEVLVKITYKQLSGYFTSDHAASAKSALHQPYWFHAMIAKARVAILRQILNTGQSNELAGRANAWPLVVSNTDMIGYAAESIDPPEAAWPGDPAKLGRGPGAYKPVRYAELAEHSTYLTRRGWSGREATRRFADGPPE